jgi:hypothetical protein
VLFRSNPQNPQGPLAARRDSPVVCHVCGHTVARASRRQKFCSTRCRQKYAVGKNGRGCVISDGLGQDSPDTTNPHFSLNKINGLQGRKSGPNPPILGPRHVIEAEVFAGRDWAPVTSPHGVTVLVASRNCRRPR